MLLTPDPPRSANLNLVLVAPEEFHWRAARALFYIRTANETLQSRRGRSSHKDVEEPRGAFGDSWGVDVKPRKEKEWQICSNHVTMILQERYFAKIECVLAFYERRRDTNIAAINIIICWESIYTRAVCPTFHCSINLPTSERLPSTFRVNFLSRFFRSLAGGELINWRRLINHKHRRLS